MTSGPSTKVSIMALKLKIIRKGPNEGEASLVPELDLRVGTLSRVLMQPWRTVVWFGAVCAHAMIRATNTPTSGLYPVHGNV